VVSRASGAITALWVSDPVERIATVFTRSREIAATYVRDRGSTGVYADFLLEPAAEPFDIYAVAPSALLPSYRFHHPVRPIRPDDVPAVLELLQEVYGGVNPQWFEGVPRSSELGFVSEVDGRIAGVGWISTAGVFARLHSLTVRAPYRRLGLGSDLLWARLLWARAAGVTEMLSEISRFNAASQALALRAGMRPVGQIYWYRPQGGPDAGTTSEVRRSSDSAPP
jgi:GNAT superfamily N-acetyltransferase